MFNLLRRRASRPAPTRTRRLQLEGLENRENPTTPPYAPGFEPTAAQGSDSAPKIKNFEVETSGNGVFMITGKVEDDASPAGLVINLRGTTSCSGQTVTCDQYGYFAIQVTLRTDGSDAGLITAQTVDHDDHPSNIVERWVLPMGN